MVMALLTLVTPVVFPKKSLWYTRGVELDNSIAVTLLVNVELVMLPPVTELREIP